MFWVLGLVTTQAGSARLSQAQPGSARLRQAQAGSGRTRHAQVGPGRSRLAQAGSGWLKKLLYNTKALGAVLGLGN